MASPAAEHRQSDPSPDGSARPDPCGHGADPGHAEPRQRSSWGQEGLSMAMVQRLQNGFGSPRFQLPMLHRSAKLAFADLSIVRTVKSSQANGALRDTHAISE